VVHADHHDDPAGDDGREVDCVGAVIDTGLLDETGAEVGAAEHAAGHAARRTMIAAR